MRRIRALVPLLFVGVASPLAGGCTENEQTLVILQNQVPEEGCVVPGAPTTSFRPRGVLDVTDVRPNLGYLFAPVVKNYAVTGGSITEAQRLVQVRGADIDIEFQEGLFEEGELAPEVLSFSQRFSGAIDPDGGTTSFLFEIIPVQVVDALRGRLDPGGDHQTSVKVTITIFGDMGGSNVSSDPYVFWVDVCHGCLVVDQGDCAEAAPSSRTGGECNPRQDAIVDCCREDGTLFCPIGE